MALVCSFIIILIYHLNFIIYFYLAIWNFKPEAKEVNRLESLIGEPVHICEENDNWYYGYSLVSSDDQMGIFPKSYVTVQEYEIRLVK